jgi:hypothetical protein
LIVQSQDGVVGNTGLHEHSFVLRDGGSIAVLTGGKDGEFIPGGPLRRMERRGIGEPGFHFALGDGTGQGLDGVGEFAPLQGELPEDGAQDGRLDITLRGPESFLIGREEEDELSHDRKRIHSRLIRRFAMKRAPRKYYDR